MSLITKCDFSGKTEVPMVELKPGNQFHYKIEGEKVDYLITIIPRNGFGGEHIAQEYICEELHKRGIAIINDISNDRRQAKEAPQQSAIIEIGAGDKSNEQ